jgi:TolA-binding protein
MTRIDDDDHDRLRELAQQLSYDRPDAERREAVRSSLLVAATQPARSNRRWLLAGGGFLAGALAAAAIAIIVISPRESTTLHAKIDAPPTAKLEHVVSKTDTGTDELVRIRAGVVRLSVPAVKRGDRVRTQTSDAEVEGTGSYEVAVIDDKLRRVTVDAGTARIDLRVDGKQQQVFLAAGETWRPTIVTASIDPPASRVVATTGVEATSNVDARSSSNPATTTKSNGMTGVAANPTNVAARSNGATKPDVATSSNSTAKSNGIAPNPSTTAHPPRAPAVTTLDPPPVIATTKQSKTEQHFQRGWKLLRDGHAGEAAVELAAAADADVNDPLAGDARYFQAVALVRSGKSADAERVLVAFLDHAPMSLRRGRAAILLGKLLRDRGDAKSARAWFESALADGDPAIAAAAKAHLDALSPR